MPKGVTLDYKSDYSVYHPGNWSIYRLDLASGITRKIIPGALYVSVSPSSDYLVVGLLNKGYRDIFLFNTNGQNPIRLTSNPVHDFAPIWSPDGRTIELNSKGTGCTKIFLMDIHFPWIKWVTSDCPYSSYNPQWYPAGDKIIYYLEKEDGKDQVYMIKRVRSVQINLTRDSILNYFPSWKSND